MLNLKIFTTTDEQGAFLLGSLTISDKVYFTLTDLETGEITDINSSYTHLVKGLKPILKYRLALIEKGNKNARDK